MAQTEIKLWDSTMPGHGAAEPEFGEAKGEPTVYRIRQVSEPTLTFYPVESATPTPVVIICPGGGYTLLAYDLEGTEIAAWLNGIGLSAAVLKYRVPQNRAGALEDVQQAVRLMREKASDWNIQPQQIGMIGFSAGAHLTAACSMTEDRPNFSMLIYPAYLFKPDTTELRDEIVITKQTPPAFIAQTQDDKNHYRSSLAYANALTAANIAVELHLFAQGGHGYGLRPSENPISTWPILCEKWLRTLKLFPAEKIEGP